MPPSKMPPDDRVLEWGNPYPVDIEAQFFLSGSAGGKERKGKERALGASCRFSGKLGERGRGKNTRPSRGVQNNERPRWEIFDRNQMGSNLIKGKLVFSGSRYGRAHRE